MTDWADEVAWDIMALARRDSPPKLMRALIAARLRVIRARGERDGVRDLRDALGIAAAVRPPPDLPTTIPRCTTAVRTLTAPDWIREEHDDG